MEKVLDMKKPVSRDTLEDSEMNGVSSLLRMKEGWGNDGNDGKSEGLGFVLRGVDMNSKGDGDKKKQEADGGLPDGRTVLVGGSGSGAAGNFGVKGSVSADNGGVREEEIRKLHVESQNEERDLACIEEHGYSVGDFVWGKIKSHPWWPGRVYDSSDASEFAVKLRQEGKLLVAYFGDGTFAWCHPSQLRPFEENFEEMMNQSSSKAFFNAVREAVGEIGMLVNLKMTCPCVRGTEQTRPFVVNSGVKEGVLLPDEGIEKLRVTQIEPTDFLTSLRHKAQVANVASGLELGVLKGWILGFYRAKVGLRYKLPEYVDPDTIPGLEDLREDAGGNGREYAGESGEIGVPSWGPVEEEKEAEKHGASANGTQRKQKSIAEILGSNQHSKSKVSRRKKKMANLLESSPMVLSGGSGEEINEIGKGEHEKKRGRPKKRASPSSESGGGGMEESELQKGKSVDESDAKDSSEKGYISRERKKSKYLSPPYTNINKGDKKGHETTESLSVSGVVRLGERMTKAAQNLVGPNEKFSSASPMEVLTEQKTLNSQTPKQGKEETIVLMEVKASAREVLSKVHSLACDPQRRLSLDAVEGFLYNFRSSVYIENSNSDAKSKGQTGRMSKSQDKIQSDLSALKVKSRGRKPKKTSGPEIETKKLHSVPISYDESLSPTDRPSPEAKPKRKRSKKAVESELDTPNVKETNDSKPSDQKKDDKGASLEASFGPGSSLPAREELIRIFRKFGSLNENETKMYYNNFSAVIAFKKTSDAELALESSRKANPFGPANVSFKLKQSSPRKIKEGPSSQPKKPKNLSSAATPKSEASEVKVIKERLQSMVSVLDKSNGKLSKKVRLQLEDELKDVLEKISAAGGSSSSA